MLREQYIHERVWKLERERQRVLKPPESRGRGLLRAGALMLGRTLVAAGARLLAYSGEQSRGKLAPYSAPLDYSRN